MGKLDGKVAIITGAASGMGKATAVLFAQEGAKVLVADIQDELGKEIVKAINESGGKATYVHADVRRVEDVKDMIKTAVDTYGKLDILFNNAGIEGAINDTINYPDDDFENVVDTNMRGIFFGIKYGVQEMLNTGGGVIINTSSVTGYAAIPWMNGYGASKGGVIQLTKTAAQEYAGRNIRINSIAPGMIETPMLDRFFFGQVDFKAEMLQKVPMGRSGKPEEIAKTALFLASDDSSYITGQILGVDGGLHPH